MKGMDGVYVRQTSRQQRVFDLQNSQSQQQHKQHVHTGSSKVTFFLMTLLLILTIEATTCNAFHNSIIPHGLHLRSSSSGTSLTAVRFHVLRANIGLSNTPSNARTSSNSLPGGHDATIQSSASAPSNSKSNGNNSASASASASSSNNNNNNNTKSPNGKRVQFSPADRRTMSNSNGSSYSNGNSSSNNGNTYNKHQRKRNVTSSSSSRPPQQKNRKYFRQHDNSARDKGDFEWLDSTTRKVLAAPSTPNPTGAISPTPFYPIDQVRRLMRTWARRAVNYPQDKTAPRMTTLLFQKILEINANKRKPTSSNIATEDLNNLLEAWSTSNKVDSIAQMKDHLYASINGTYSSYCSPNIDSLNVVLESIANAASSISSIQDITQKWTAYAQKQNNPSLDLNRASYNSILLAWANSSSPDAPKEARSLLRTMQAKDAAIAMTRKLAEHEQLVDIRSYNSVVTTYIKLRRSEYQDELHSLLLEIVNLPKDRGILPTVDTFNMVMGAWLKYKTNTSPMPYRLSKILESWKLMEESFQNGNKFAKPDRVSINTLIAAYTKEEGVNMDDLTSTLSRIEDRYNIIPNTITHNLWIRCWSRSAQDDAPERALRILDQMEQEWIQHVEQTSQSTKQVKHNLSWFKAQQNLIKPDAYSYASVMEVFCKFSPNDAGERAEEVLRRMIKLEDNFNGDPVNTEVYNAALNAWAISASTGYARPGYIEERVQALFKKMEDRSLKRSVCRPSRITYNTVMKAMQGGTIQQAKCAENLLLTLERKGRTDSRFMPDIYSYQSVITAYGKSDCPDRAFKALEILQRMIASFNDGNKFARPSVFTFNAVLNACAFSEGYPAKRKDAFGVALQVFDMIPTFARPDHVSFGTMLRACASLLAEDDRERPQAVDRLFSMACEQGQVGKFAMIQLKYATTPAKYYELTNLDSNEQVSSKDIPTAWARNVRERRG